MSGDQRASVVPNPSAGARLLAALGLISAAVTAQQIALMQVLGWMHWHHFAYMVVAVALLGFGIAGTVLSLARDRLVANWERVVPWLLLAAAVSMPLGVRLAQTEALAVDLPLVFFDPANVWRLVALCVLLLPPFFFAGLVTGLILTVHAHKAGRYYAASLGGAGFGGVAGLALVACVAPPMLAPVIAILALAAAACLSPRLTLVTRSGTLIALVLVLAMGLAPGELRPSQFKPIRRTLDLPGAQVVAQRPGVHGWTQIVDAPALRPAPAVSLQFQGEIPAQRAVFVNGLGYGALLDDEAVAAPRWLDYTTDAAAFAVNAPKRVLLLENGPGGWAALANNRGATHIRVVEPNGALVGLLSSRTPANARVASTGGSPPSVSQDSGYMAPEWQLNSVDVVVASGRAHLRRTRDHFDVIRFPSVGALGGTAGLASASEQFLLTREAFVEAWQRLEPAGIIAVTAWMDFPERNPLRLLATLAEAIEQAGGTPRAHLAAVRGWAAVTFLARREPWTAANAAALREFCEHRGFDPLLLPDLKADEREASNAWQNPGFFRLVDALVDGPREPVYRDHAFLLRPPTDHRPYFSQFVRWTKTERLREVFGARTMPFFELGSLVVALTFAVLAALALVCILLPLVKLGWSAPGKAGVLLYFGGLGAGFMCVEIGLMLRAHAWLGSPVLAAALVITSLLIASGVGSLWSERLRADPGMQRRATATIAAAILIASALLSGLGPLAHTWPSVAQLALLLGIVACVGAAMGTAFPVGVRRLEATHPPHIPWAWAINGCVSVATPAGVMLLAMNAGFTALFVAGAAAYAVAFLGALLSAASATRSR